MFIYFYYTFCIRWVSQHHLKQLEDLDCQTPGNFPGQGWVFLWNLVIGEFAMENQHSQYVVIKNHP